ncbi:MAG: hypothetical protein P8R54_27810 [Myxococcota bacterium]|nr:hypothetical protein [Myxococcota bacterium]
MTSPSFHIFRPSEGAVLDLDSLKAIAASSDRLLTAYLDARWPGISGMVLHGLEMEGDWASGGPPGTRRPDSQSTGVRISPGSAIVTSRDGRKFMLRVDEELRVRWPTRAGSAVRGVLVLLPEVAPARIKGGLVVARETVRAQLGFVEPRLADRPYYLPIAAAVGNGQDWATDIRRIWQPEHEAIGLLLKRFERLEQGVWRAEPQGAVWDRQVIGRNWTRYQTVAAASLQSARSVLMSRPSTTLDRVRLLRGLREQLSMSVDEVATQLLQLIGSREGAGPYAAVIPPARE